MFSDSLPNNPQNKKQWRWSILYASGWNPKQALFWSWESRSSHMITTAQGEFPDRKWDEQLLKLGCCRYVVKGPEGPVHRRCWFFRCLKATGEAWGRLSSSWAAPLRLLRLVADHSSCSHRSALLAFLGGCHPAPPLHTHTPMSWTCPGTSEPIPHASHVGQQGPCCGQGWWFSFWRWTLMDLVLALPSGI